MRTPCDSRPWRDDSYRPSWGDLARSDGVGECRRAAILGTCQSVILTVPALHSGPAGLRTWSAYRSAAG
jgi:hypothetical protein